MDLNEECELEALIQKIAIATLKNGGIAFKLDTAEFLPPRDFWSFPKYPGTTAIVPQDVKLADELRGFVVKNKGFLKEPDCWLGTWIHRRAQGFYLDISRLVNALGERS